MNRTSQWLFEAPVAPESNRYTNPYFNPEYYNDSEVFKPRQPERKPSQSKPRKAVPTKPQPKVPEDRLVEIYIYWDLQVPFKKDLAAFRQEVEKAIGRHVAPAEKKNITSLLGQLTNNLKNLETIQKKYSNSVESALVKVKAALRFTKNNHTGLDWLYLDIP
jgi:hypothetical protein